MSEFKHDIGLKWWQIKEQTNSLNIRYWNRYIKSTLHTSISVQYDGTLEET